MKVVAEIISRILAGAVVLTGVATPMAAGPAAGEQIMPERSGPWAFSRPSRPGRDDAPAMATTPAAEDANVWLLLVCDRAHLAAAVMHATRFPYAVIAESAMVLRFSGHPDLAAETLPVGANQLSIVDATSRRLMPLIISSERVVVSLSDSGGAAHAYTFSLQPNGTALAAIVHGCWDDR